MVTPPLSNATLSAIARTILDSNSTFIQLRDSLEQLSRGLSALVALDPPPQTLHYHSAMLEVGKALDPISASYCINDFYRTTIFVRGLHQAVLAAQQKCSAPIHVLYAGTGPYATLMLPLTTVFSPAEVQFTLIEVHSVSFEKLKETLACLHVNSYVKDLIFADATQIQLDTLDPVHVLVTETMQSALAKEPQVAITQHLSAQLSPDAIFLPEQVHVWAGLSNPLRYDSAEDFLQPPPSPHFIGTLMDLRRSTPDTVKGIFPKISIEIPAELRAQYQLLNIYTEVKVFADHTLRPDQSGITLPVSFGDLQKSAFTGGTVTMQYQISQQPGFKRLDEPK